MAELYNFIDMNTNVRETNIITNKYYTFEFIFMIFLGEAAQ